jgi:hypothetical protein
VGEEHKLQIYSLIATANFNEVDPQAASLVDVLAR